MNNNPEELEENLYNKTKNQFLDLKNLFTSNEIKVIDIQFLERLVNQLNNKELEKEIIKLKKIFKINDNKYDKYIYEELMILKNRKNMSYLLNNIIFYLDGFNIHKNKIHFLRDNLKDVVDNLKINNENLLSSLLSINKHLKNMKLNILNDYSCRKTQSILNYMYFYPELLNFILIHDIKTNLEMKDYIHSEKDIFNDFDMNQLSSIIEFIQTLKKYKDQQEKEMVMIVDERKILDNLIDVTCQNCYKSLDKYFQNISFLFHNYFENHIINIYKKCIIHLEYSELYFLLSQNFNYEAKFNYNNINFVENSKGLSQMCNVLQFIQEYYNNCEYDSKLEYYFKCCCGLKKIFFEINEIICELNKNPLKKRSYEINIKNGEVLNCDAESCRFSMESGNNESYKYLLDSSNSTNSISYNRSKYQNKVNDVKSLLSITNTKIDDGEILFHQNNFSNISNNNNSHNDEKSLKRIEEESCRSSMESVNRGSYKYSLISSDSSHSKSCNCLKCKNKINDIKSLFSIMELNNTYNLTDDGEILFHQDNLNNI
eukprot:jgi/Orpsp1_1/1189114/evm.model.d7180000069583.1